MLDAVHRLAKGGDVAGNAGGGFVLAHQDGFDLVLLIGAERGQIALDGGAFAPRGFQHLDLKPQPLAHVDPQVAELAEPGREDFVARIQTVGERSLPAAGPRGGEENRGGRGGFEYRLQGAQARSSQLREDRRAVILHCNHHGARDAVGNIGGTGDE